MRISDWSSDVCSSDLLNIAEHNLSMLSPSPLNSFRAAGVAPPALQRMFRRSITAVDCTSRSVRDIHVRRRDPCRFRVPTARSRSEEHTSELQSLMRISYAVLCLKKKNTIK